MDHQGILVRAYSKNAGEDPSTVADILTFQQRLGRQSLASIQPSNREDPVMVLSLVNNKERVS